VVALAHFEGWNEFGFGINRAERPNITFGRIVVNPAVFFLFADEAPNLIELEQIARQTAHLAIQKRGATLPNSHA